MHTISVAELFAGVGGFRLGLEGYDDPKEPGFAKPSAGPFKTIWANQWEPPGSPAKQFAWRCYEERFGADSCINRDINEVLDAHESGELEIPDVDMVVGGFPCQDYSVAKPLSQAGGIDGKKGVLWWDIYRFLHLKAPRYVLLENVDRLLKSPASQRGRDFAIMLSCFADLGYSVEWRVVNSAEYGAPQRRKRVYIYAELAASAWDLEERLKTGVLATALPVQEVSSFSRVEIPDDPYEATQSFNTRSGAKSPFLTAGVMQGCHVLTTDVLEAYEGERKTLKDVIVPENPSRTILTGEGGAGASRFKHVIKVGERYRRLVPDELDLLQGFPKGWTDTSMTDGQRAFCMGNALVVQIPHEIGKVIAQRHVDGQA